MNDTIQTGRRPATPFARRFGTLALATVIGLGVLTPVPASAEGLPPHTDMPAPLLRQSAAVNPDYPQMPAPTVEAHLSAPDAVTGHLDVSWEAIPDVEKYQIILFNGAYHSYWDVPATETSWTTKGKGMFPTPEQLQAGTIDYLRNGSGMEFLAQPSPLYEQAYEQKGGTDYSLTDNYYVRVTAVHHDGARPISPATKARIPIMEPDEVPSMTVGEMLDNLVRESKGSDNLEEYEAAIKFLEEFSPKAEMNEELLLEVFDHFSPETNVGEDEEQVEEDSASTFSNVDSRMGHVLYTPVPAWNGFRHGHAGIASAKKDAVIEANPGDGVREYEKRYGKYWMKKTNKGSRYEVRNTTTQERYTAYLYAKKQSQLNKPYALTPGAGTSSFYCSELVYRSWFFAGRSIGEGAYWKGGYVLPSHLASSKETKLKAKYFY